MAQRKAGFGHVTGHFNAALAVQHVDAAVVARALPPWATLHDRGPGPEGTHPLVVFYANGVDVRWSPLRVVPLRVDVMAILVPGVRVEGAAYRGAFSYTLAWWAGNSAVQRWGGKLMGLPSRPERLQVDAGKVEWSVGVPGLVSMKVFDGGAQPDWPKVRALCPVIQQPLVAQTPTGSRIAAGMYWNLGDADMRNCSIETTIEGALLGGERLQTSTVGTSNPASGGAIRMGAQWTLTRAGDLQREWGLWRSSPTLRLRADFALVDVDRQIPRPRPDAGNE